MFGDSSAKRRPSIDVPWHSWEALVVFVLSWIGVPLFILSLFKYAAPYDANIQHFITAIYANDITASFQLTVLDALGSLGIVWLVLGKYKVSWASLGIKKFDLLKSTLWVGTLLVVFFFVAYAALLLTKILVPGFNPDQAQVNEFTSATGSARVISFLALVVIPPLIEEILFRGFMFPAFSKRLGVVGGALLSSLLFGLAHLQANVGVYTVVLGLLLCYMYNRTRSIIPGMALHMLNNYIAYIAIMGK